MTVTMKMSRTAAAQLIANDKRTRAPTNYSKAMIEAEELVRALEVLGVVKFSIESPFPAPACGPGERPR